MRFDPILYEPEEESSPTELKPFIPDLGPERNTPTPQASPEHTVTRRAAPDPGLGVLFEQGDPNLGILMQPGARDSSSESASDGSSAMTDRPGAGQHILEPQPYSSNVVPGTQANHYPVDPVVLGRQAAAALASGGAPPDPLESYEHATRVDSAQDRLFCARDEKRRSRSGRATPLGLRVQTGASTTSSDDTITSPTLRKHKLTAENGNTGTLPALTSPATNGAPTSPQSERLPSFHHLTELADVAMRQQQEVRAPQHPHHQHSMSFGSAVAQSPQLPYHIPSNMNAQTSPASQYAFNARSPTSTIGDMPYGSPTQYPGAAYYAGRRTSTVLDHPIALPASLPSASSSGESHGAPGSSTDGYSTAHTTPIDIANLPENVRNMPILPPPRNMPQSALVIPGAFRCDYPGCDAQPFSTQYLLSSHKNVHSSSRPHYCPVVDCARAEGGRGFKRKNEMIRHGLVHNSPGYVCPFCPEREHKYPRPDNLQRHVRVHHVDKDRDDPQLREVLNQRTEGATKSRRKRANTGPN